MGILVSLLIGALAGLLAGLIMKKGMSLLVCILVGLVGGVLGSWVFSLIGLTASSNFWGQLLVGTCGSVLLLFILSLFKKKN